MPEETCRKSFTDDEQSVMLIVSCPKVEDLSCCSRATWLWKMSEVWNFLLSCRWAVIAFTSLCLAELVWFVDVLCKTRNIDVYVVRWDYYCSLLGLIWCFILQVYFAGFRLRLAWLPCFGLLCFSADYLVRPVRFCWGGGCSCVQNGW